MPKRKTKDTEGVVLCLAHKDGRVACAKTGKLLNGGETHRRPPREAGQVDR